jgi:hypothetical protein
VVAFGEIRGGRGSLDVKCCGRCEVTILLVQECRCRAVAGHAGVDVGQGGQSGPRSVGLTDRDGTVESNDRAVGEHEQFVVPLDDLHPVGLVDRVSIGVQCGDRRLGLVRPEHVARQGPLKQRDALGDRLDVPPGAVLIRERDQAAVVAGAGLASGVVQQHQRQQAAHLRVIGDGGQPARQPDRLGGQVDVPRVALVEHQVQRGEHGAEVTVPVEADVGYDPLGAADPLRHRRFGHQVGGRDLPRRESAHRPQRQGHRRGRRERGVCAQEVQLQRVVDILGRAGCRLGENALLPTSPSGVGADQIQELPPRHGDEPTLGVRRRIGVPAADCDHQRLLHGVLGRREVGSATDEDPKHCGDQLPQLVAHSVTVGAAE